MLLELFPIVLAVELWGTEFRDRRVRFHCDNLGVVHAINSLSAASLAVVRLLWHLVLRCLLLNIVVVCAVHIPGIENCVADALSRLQWDRFSQLAPGSRADRGSVPQLSMGSGASTVMALVQRLVADATWRSYERVLREWHKLVSSIGGCPGNDDRQTTCVALFLKS